MSTINSIHSNLHAFQGIPITTVTIRGKQYRVSVSIEDSNGKNVSLSNRLSHETLQKTQNLIESLVAAHQAQGFEDSSSPQLATSKGLTLTNGRTISHDFLLDPYKSQLSTEKLATMTKISTEIKKDFSDLKAQDLWNRTEELVLADTASNPLPEQNSPHNSETPPEKPWQPASSNQTPTPTPDPIPPAPVPTPPVNHTHPTPQPFTPPSPPSPITSPHKIHPIEKWKTFNAFSKNPLSSGHYQLYLKQQAKYEAHKQRQEATHQPTESFESFLKQKLQLKRRKILQKKYSLENKSKNLYCRHKISNNVTHQEIKEMFNELKRDSLFDADQFYGYIYQEAKDQQIATDPSNPIWGEEHLFDHITVFLEALNKYISKEWADQQFDYTETI